MKPTYKLLKVDGYWIMGCNIEKALSKGTLYIDDTMTIRKSVITDEDYWKSRADYIQLIASQNPEHNLPTITFSDEVAKELGIVDLDKLAHKQVEIEGWGKFDGTSEQNGIANAYVDGYNQALSDNKDKLFTLEQLKDTLQKGVNIGMQNVEKSRFENDFNFNQEKAISECKEYIQSLTKQEYEVRLVMENEIVKCIDNTDLERTIKIGEEFENYDKEGSVTINKNGWWVFPTYNRWEVISNKQPKITNNSVKVIKIYGTN